MSLSRTISDAWDLNLFTIRITPTSASAVCSPLHDTTSRQWPQRSSVRYPATQTTRYRRSVMMISSGWRSRVQQSPVEGLSRLREMSSQWNGIPIGNGPRKKWIFENISTNWQWQIYFHWRLWYAVMKLRDDPEKWPNSTPCRKPSNKSVCDVWLVNEIGVKLPRMTLKSPSCPRNSSSPMTSDRCNCFSRYRPWKRLQCIQCPSKVTQDHRLKSLFDRLPLRKSSTEFPWKTNVTYMVCHVIPWKFHGNM